jgi:hypothetical protein
MPPIRKTSGRDLDALANITLRCNRNVPICFSPPLYGVYCARDLVER